MRLLFLSLISLFALFSCKISYAANSSSINAIWSELTDFEKNVLSKERLAQQGDADALLGLYLLASGDIRYFEDYERILSSVNHFIKQFQLEIKGETSNEVIGMKLHEAMHETFFLGGNKGDDMGKGYYFDQSKLSDIFYTKRFNCISSSLLYIVLARKLNLDVQGVLLPSHAFVQLNLEDGSYVDVETTSINGFGWEHDEAFYEEDDDDKSWFEQRGLTPSTYLDYKNREVVSPFKVGVRNMRNQHTFEENMRYESRFRIAEVATLLDGGADFHKYRLSFYNQEFKKMNDGLGHQLLIEMFSKIKPYLDSLENNSFNDLELENLLGWVRSQYAYSLLMAERFDEARDAAIANYFRLPLKIDDREGIRINTIVILHKVVTHYLEQINYEKAARVFGEMTQDCLQDDDCRGGIARVYGEWISSYWDAKQWRKVIETADKYLKLDPDSQSSFVFKQNMTAAYSNWANRFAEASDWKEMKRILNLCLDAVPDDELCRGNLNKVEQLLNQ
ncbi:transglutaminase family protein [Aliikangiella sp. G2MR2-5]|uniref:transglutaminase family protein n=1 Tax=Aliikangiella sp. G2MR2-5 TaxID=2788943 RepID=UPI0018A98BC1|nr:transglutaminase family protein [Aliikangiella sp. G2MR2-5]